MWFRVIKWERLQSCKGRFLWTYCTVQARSVAREQSHTDLHCRLHINTHKYWRDSAIPSHSLLAMHHALCKPYCRKQFPDPSSHILVYFLSPWTSSRWIIKLCKNNFSSVQYFVSKCTESKLKTLKHVTEMKLFFLKKLNKTFPRSAYQHSSFNHFHWPK